MSGRLFGGRGLRRIAAGLALLVAVGVVVALVVAAGSSSPKPTGDSGGSSATTVQRRDLVETDTQSGTLSHASPQTVYNRLGGTVTWLPSVGQTIGPGHTLFKVSGQPAILMTGATPAYRDLRSSDSAGQDILELNHNLVDLGFNPGGIVVNDSWQAATTVGVDAFQASLGETQTGSLTLGHVVFLPGDQLVSTVEGTLGSTEASDPEPASGPEFVDLHTTITLTSTTPTPPTTTTPTTTTPTTTTTMTPTSPAKPGKNHKRRGTSKLTELEALIAVLKSEIAEMKASDKKPSSASPSSSNSGNPSSSNNNNSNTSGGGSATAILQTTSTQLVVTVDLDASKQSEAKVGERRSR
jgi:hypothetical protein